MALFDPMQFSQSNYGGILAQLMQRLAFPQPTPSAGFPQMPQEQQQAAIPPNAMPTQMQAPPMGNGLIDGFQGGSPSAMPSYGQQQNIPAADLLRGTPAQMQPPIDPAALPPNAMPTQQPGMPGQSPGGFNMGNLATASRNFAGGVGLLPRIFDAMQGLSTGQRTDPAGIAAGIAQQKQLQLGQSVYNTLVSQGVPAQQAATLTQAAMVDPKIAEQITGQSVKLMMPEKTTNMRDVESENAMRKARGMPEILPSEYKKSGATNVSVDQRGEGEYAKVTNKNFAEMNMELLKGAISARGTMIKLDRMGQLLADPNVYTGAGGETVLSLKRAAKSMGIDVGNIGGSEAIAAIGNEMALELRNPAGGAGMPGAMSDKDREFLQTMPPGLSKTPDGNRKLIDYRKRVLQRSIDVDKLRQAYVAKNGRLDEGFFQELAAFSDANPIFSDADFATTAPAAGGGNVTKSGVSWGMK